MSSSRFVGAPPPDEDRVDDAEDAQVSETIRRRDRAGIHFGEIRGDDVAVLDEPSGDAEDEDGIVIERGEGEEEDEELEDEEDVEMEDQGRLSEEQQAYLRRLERDRRARAVLLPTDDNEVRLKLRSLSQPITLFGEGPPERRERLRLYIAQHEQEIVEKLGVEADDDEGLEEQKRPFFSVGPDALKNFRVFLAEYSVPRARERLRSTRESSLKRAKVLKEYLKRLHAWKAEFQKEATATKEEERQKRLQLRSGNDEAFEEPKEKAERDEKRKQEVLATMPVLETDDETLLQQQKVADRVSKLKKYGVLSSEIADSRPLTSCALTTIDGSQQLAIAGLSGVASVWNVSDSSRCTKQYVLKGHEERIHGVAWHPTTPLVATASADATVNLWSLTASEKQTVLPTLPSTTSATHPEDSSVDPTSATTTTSSVVVVSPLHTLRGHESRLARCAFHPTGRVIASTSYDACWRLWDVETGAELLEQDGHARSVYGVAFHPDGSLAATTDLSGLVRLWDLRTGRSLCILKGHSKESLCADFHPNGYHLASGSNDHTVRIWDLRRRESIYVIPAHQSVISAVRYHGDGNVLMSASFDRTIKVWKAGVGRRSAGDTGASGAGYGLAAEFRGHESRVSDICSTPDGSHIFSVSHDRTWKLWGYDPYA